MMKIGSTIAIIQDNKILLTKREDFEVWCLPGGHSEPGESLAQTAIREAYEETGLIVELTRLIGVYSRVGGPDIHGALFAAMPVSGELKPQIEEVIDIGYFCRDEIPADLFWWHRQQIGDALDGVGGSAAWTMRIHPAEDFEDRQQVYALRDKMNLPRSEFYRYYYEQRTDDIKHDVGD